MTGDLPGGDGTATCRMQHPGNIPRHAVGPSSTRVVLDRLARIRPLLEPVTEAPPAGSGSIADLLAAVDQLAAGLARAVERGDSLSIDQAAQHLHELETRVQRHWVGNLDDGPRSDDVARLTEACRLLRDAALALQPGVVW